MANGDAEAIIASTQELVLVGQPPRELEAGKRYVFVVPPGAVPVFHDTLDADLAPERTKGTVTVHTADGFEAVVIGRLGSGGTSSFHLYADVPRHRLVGVLNDDTVAGPGWRDHRVDLALEPTPEWEHWTRHAGLGSLSDFAHAIEDGIDEIVDPAGAVMLEAAQEFSVQTDVKFKEAKRLKDGQTQLVYEEVVNADTRAGAATLPDEFTLLVAPFFGVEPRQIRARFRFRVQSGKLSVGYELIKADQFERAAFAEVVSTVAETLSADAIEGVAPPER